MLLLKQNGSGMAQRCIVLSLFWFSAFNTATYPETTTRQPSVDSTFTYSVNSLLSKFSVCDNVAFSVNDICLHFTFHTFLFLNLCQIQITDLSDLFFQA